jgi:large conductance mechanosensitive channel
LGAAFGKIVSSFVGDLLMPPIGMLLGKMDFSNLYVNLSGGDFPSLLEAKKAGAATLNYGVFLNALIDFLITAGAVFGLIQFLAKLQKAPQAAPANTKECPQCCSAIAIPAKRCPACTSVLAG